MTEIKRKFLVKDLPNLTSLPKESFERHYLLVNNGIELRIQRINERYELERLVKKENSARDIQTLDISEQEFQLLKALSNDKIIRDVYIFSKDTEICIYHDRFEGLIRVEVSFDSEENAKRYKPLNWIGREITNTPLWRDSSLLELSEIEFSNLII